MDGAGREEDRADYGGGTVRQLSPLFDAPQYAEQFIALARKTLRSRDLKIRAKAALTDAKGKRIINPKTKAPKIGFSECPLSLRNSKRRPHDPLSPIAL